MSLYKEQGVFVCNVICQPLRTGRQTNIGTIKEDGRYSSVFLLIVFICIYSVPTFVIFAEYTPVMVDVSNGVIMIILFIAVVVMMIFVCLSSTWQQRGYLMFPLQTESLNMRHVQLSLYGVYLFGTGVIIYSAFRLLEVLQCFPYYKHVGKHFIVMVIYLGFDLIRIIFVAVQMFFFRMFKTSVMVSTCCFRYAFILIITANICCWFEVTSMEAMERLDVTNQWSPTEFAINPSNSNITIGTNDIEWLCFNSTTVMQKIQSILQVIFVPFVTEYSVMSAGLLFHYWGSLTTTLNQPAHATDELESPLLKINDVEDVGEVGHKAPIIKWHSQLSALPIVAILLSILLLISATLMFITGFFSGAPLLYTYVETFFNMSMFFIGLLAFHYNIKLGQSSNLHLNSHEILCIVSVTGVIFLETCNFVSSIALINYTERRGVIQHSNYLCVGNLMESITCIAQVWVQTTLIISVRRRSFSGNPKVVSGLKECLLYLAVCNATLWIHDSFIATVHFDLESPENFLFFGSSTWNIATIILFPMLIFYRFHSFLLCGTYSRMLASK